MGNAWSHKLQVGKWCSLASHYTLTTGPGFAVLEKVFLFLRFYASPLLMQFNPGIIHSQKYNKNNPNSFQMSPWHSKAV